MVDLPQQQWESGYSAPMSLPSWTAASRLNLGRRALRGPAGGLGRLGRPSGLGRGDLGQIVGEDAPADPAAEAVLAVVAAAGQAVVALQDVDAPLGPGPE